MYPFIEYVIGRRISLTFPLPCMTRLSFGQSAPYRIVNRKSSGPRDYSLIDSRARVGGYITCARCTRARRGRQIFCRGWRLAYAIKADVAGANEVVEADIDGYRLFFNHLLLQ